MSEPLPFFPVGNCWRAKCKKKLILKVPFTCSCLRPCAWFRSRWRNETLRNAAWPSGGLGLCGGKQSSFLITALTAPHRQVLNAAIPGGVCQFHVLIVYADPKPPTQLQSEIQAEPNVVSVDVFDASVGIPTLGQLQQYDIVVPFGDTMFIDSDTLGNNLADYVDGGGIVVQYGFSHAGPGDPAGINGRWLTDGYNPYDYSENLETNPFSLGAFNAGHPLMVGVATLNSDFANVVTPNAAATEVAQNSLGESLVAYRPVDTHTTVGVTAYVGTAAIQSGDWGKVIVNAGNWLLNCQGSPTPTPTATPTATPSPTPSVTPTATPRATPTPRPRPTPHPRP